MSVHGFKFQFLFLQVIKETTSILRSSRNVRYGVITVFFSYSSLVFKLSGMFIYFIFFIIRNKNKFRSV